MFLFCGLVLAGEDVISPAEKEYNASLEALKKDYDKKVNTVKEKFLAALKTQLAELTKKGDFDNAMKVKERITKLTLQSIATTLVGKWDLRTVENPYKATVTFMADGTAMTLAGAMQNPGKWSVEDGHVIVLWSSGNKYVITNMNDDEIKCEAWLLSSPNSKTHHILRKINE